MFCLPLLTIIWICQLWDMSECFHLHYLSTRLINFASSRPLMSALIVLLFPSSEKNFFAFPISGSLIPTLSCFLVLSIDDLLFFIYLFYPRYLVAPFYRSLILYVFLMTLLRQAITRKNMMTRIIKKWECNHFPGAEQWGLSSGCCSLPSLVTWLGMPLFTKRDIRCTTMRFVSKNDGMIGTMSLIEGCGVMWLVEWCD